MTPALQIRVREGADAGRVIPLRGRDVYLGRGEPALSRPDRINFADGTVSRQQARLQWSDAEGGYVLTHQDGATNPTSINHRRAQRHVLAPGDMVRIGRLLFEVEAMSEPPEEPSFLLPDEPEEESAGDFPVTETLALPGEKPPPETRSWQTHAPYVLVVEGGDPRDDGRVLPLTEAMMATGDPVRLGTAGERENDFVLHDPELSNDQASLQFRDGAFRLSPSPRATPVVVNGMRLQGAWLLRSGDRIEMAGTRLVFRETRPDGPAC